MEENNQLGFNWGRIILFVVCLVLVVGGVYLIDQKNKNKSKYKYNAK